MSAQSTDAGFCPLCFYSQPPAQCTLLGWRECASQPLSWVPERGPGGVRNLGQAAVGLRSSSISSHLQPPAHKCMARLGAPCCCWQSALPASKSERPSGDLSGLPRSFWPHFSRAPQRLCTAPASWAEPSCTATSAWSSSRWSLETAATSPCCWWTRAVGPGPRSCSSRCTVSAPHTGLCAAHKESS